MIDGTVLPVTAAAHGLLFCPLSFVNKNNNDGNNNHVPSMMVSVKDIVGVLSNFPAVPSTDAEGGV